MFLNTIPITKKLRTREVILKVDNLYFQAKTTVLRDLRIIGSKCTTPFNATKVGRRVLRNHLKMAEETGFEPASQLPGNSLSRTAH